MSEVKPYTALALQTTCHAINRVADVAAARSKMLDNIARVGRQIHAAKAFIGPDVRLVVLPEYFASSYPLGDALPVWAARAAWAPNGPEYAAMGEVAVAAAVFVSGNVYETDEHFPGLYFQTSFIVDDSGAVVLRYRRLVSMFAPTPHDVWDKYLDIYGLDAVFPVVDTEIGRLACIASEEILYPEIARCHAMRGAEVFCHSSSEVFGMVNTPKNVAKMARAYENMAFVVSANSGGLAGIGIPENSTDGGSKIVDYKGLVIAETSQGESMNAFAEIDLAALRRNRKRAGMANILSRQRFELYSESVSWVGLQPVKPGQGL